MLGVTPNVPTGTATLNRLSDSLGSGFSFGHRCVSEKHRRLIPFAKSVELSLLGDGLKHRPGDPFKA
jgi:hypothetical protein